MTVRVSDSLEQQEAAAQCSTGASTRAYAGNKEALIKRLHRLEGQLRGIERMVDEDRYCIDVLTQIGAVTSALESLAYEVLDDHVNHCVMSAIASSNRGEAAVKVEELLAAVRRFAKTR